MKKRGVAWRKKYVPKLFKELGKLTVRTMREMELQGFTNVTFGFDEAKMTIYSEKNGTCFKRELDPDYKVTDAEKE